MKRTKQRISKFDDEYTKRMVYKLFDNAERMVVIATKIRKLFAKRKLVDRRYVARMTRYYMQYTRRQWASNYVAKLIDENRLILTIDALRKRKI